MVSIHKVPVGIQLIISLICFIFRFKRGAEAHFRIAGRRIPLQPK